MALFSKHLNNKISTNKDKKVIELSKVKKEKEKITKDMKKCNRDKKTKTLKLIEDWKDIMYQTSAYTSDNKTFTFTKIKFDLIKGANILLVPFFYLKTTTQMRGRSGL